MTTKKQINSEKIVSWYIDFYLEHQGKPASVYAFAKEYKFDEAVFYKFFGSFEAIEKVVFSTFFNNTIDALEKSKEYPSFDSRNKLLSFYFTFFENLTANRSYVYAVLNPQKKNLKNLSVLSELRKSFLKYIEELDLKTIDLKQKQLTQIQDKSIKESAWIQLLITLNFWLDDSSASFEKTDIFIEKSINTSFDIMDSAPLKSIIDLGKFIYKEKMNLS